MNFLKRVPLPLSGVALGFAALGNLLAAYNMSFKIICGILAFVGLLLVAGKYLSNPQVFATDMKNPVIASVSGTYTMALMLLAEKYNNCIYYMVYRICRNSGCFRYGTGF